MQCTPAPLPLSQHSPSLSVLLPGPGERLFDRRLVLNRSHTFLAPLAVSKKEWDTCKPLKPYFSRLHRVILVDDDRWAGGWVGAWAGALLFPRCLSCCGGGPLALHGRSEWTD